MSNRGEQVRAAILQTGLAMWPDVTARGIGSALGLTHAGCLHHFKSSARLRDAIAAYAVRVRDPVVVPQLIAARHPAVSGLSEDEKRAFLVNL